MNELSIQVVVLFDDILQNCALVQQDNPKFLNARHPQKQFFI